ncbi:MAG: tetratricopeptide repeat protein, partial [Candidatus Electrothrix sp. AR3]|nr:tetratricopeptide repeat protein [Candidatus Electrothrix sp. AR3]
SDPAYNDLVENIAEFIAKRTSEAEGALTLLKRAQQFETSDHFNMIRFLGKAVTGLAKKEYSEYLTEALQLLTYAYKSAGMLWAARGTCIFLAGIKGEEENEVPISFVPTMKHLAWLALELHHLPDFLYSIQLLNGALATLPLSEDSKLKVKQDILELDAALGCLLLNLDEISFRKIENLPDILAALGLFTARAALLYLLGHTDILRSDGSFPETESDEELAHFFSGLASQPAAQELRGSIILNTEDPQTLSTKILGMIVEVKIEGSIRSILIAESVLGALEAFFSTTIEQRIVPHTEKVCINLIESDDVPKPSFELDKMDMIGTLLWPSTLSLTNFEHQNDIQSALIEVSGYILAESCVINDPKTLLQKLCVDDSVYQRMGMVAAVPNSYHRIASKNISKIDDWQEAVKRSYKLRSTRPSLIPINFKDKDCVAEVDNRESYGGKLSTESKDHRALSVRSVIDAHAWNQACWRGAAYAQISAKPQPPYLAFTFDNEKGARKIFEHWRDRFGLSDKNNDIALSIIRQLPQQNKHHYCIFITSRLPDEADYKSGQIITTKTRH